MAVLDPVRQREEDPRVVAMARAYQKLRPFLRVIPCRYDHEYGRLPKGAKCKHLLRTNPEDERYPYRYFSYYQPVEGADFPEWVDGIIVWEPNESNFQRPTFQQFYEAFPPPRIRLTPPTEEDFQQ